MMKRILGLALAGMMAMSAQAVLADGACCAAGAKAKASGACTMGAAKANSGCDAMFSKLNLTDKQKTQLAALKTQCSNATSTSERKQIFAAGIEKILTPEQMAQCETECKSHGEKAAACPMKK